MNEEKIESSTKWLMVGVAFLIDCFQIGINLFPIIGPIIGFLLDPIVSIVALIVFWIWFNKNGINIYTGKTWGGTFAAMVVEILPGFGIIPGWTIWAWSTATFARRSN